MAAELEAIALEMYDSVFRRGDYSVLDRFVDPDFVYQNPMKPVKGRQQIADLVDAQKECFRNYDLKVDRVVGNEVYVAVAWTIQGIHEKDFFGFPASNRPVSFSGITMHRFNDGRSIEAWSHSDMHERLTAT